MKKNLLFVLLIPGLLASCGECKHIDEDKNHICDICNMILSDHEDEDKNHLCDYCGQQLDDCVDSDLDGFCDYCGNEVELPFEYAEWPTKDIQDEVIVVSGSSVKIPEYRKADQIEINTDDEIEGGYFSIYCYTENQDSENEYKQIVEKAGWEFEETKDEGGFYTAYDPNYEVCMKFAYSDDYSDLEICIAFCYKTKWPEKELADYLQLLVPGTKTVIPEFEAYTIYVNYYDSKLIRAIAINAYYFNDSIIEDYKEILSKDNWDVYYNETSTEWNAISNDGLVEIHFYIDHSKNEFNVDVLEKVIPVENWPYEEIEDVIKKLGATGEVIPFKGECTGFSIEPDTLPPAIWIFCAESKQESFAEQYNQSLLDLGYVLVKNSWNEDCYAFPGTTLAYRAVIVVDVLEIELFKLAEPAE